METGASSQCRNISLPDFITALNEQTFHLAAAKTVREQKGQPEPAQNNH
jgi:hypothetical protein